MVKTLGSPSQGLPMREACAKCIGNTALAFTMQQLKAPIDAAADTQMAAEAAAPASSSPEQQQQQRAAASPVALGSAHKRGAASGSPSPGPSPRSAPVEASFEELCAEPGLLSNFIACSSTEKVHNMAKEAAAKSSGSRTPTELEAKQLSNEALSAMAALLKVWLRAGACCAVHLRGMWCYAPSDGTTSNVGLNSPTCVTCGCMTHALPIVLCAAVWPVHRVGP